MSDMACRPYEIARVERAWLLHHSEQITKEKSMAAAAPNGSPERLDRMRAALEKFLGLIDHKATYVHCERMTC